MEKKLFVGDLWFESVKSAVEIEQNRHHGVLSVKTAHLRFPKKFMNNTMKKKTKKQKKNKKKQKNKKNKKNKKKHIYFNLKTIDNNTL